jgi:predicted RNase H-like HicB family nuclease
MNNLLDKYTYRIEWSEGDNVFIARCLEFPSLSADGATQEEALDQIKEVVQSSIEWLEDDHESVPQPFSVRQYKGNLTLRIPPEIHRHLAMKCAEEGVSINQYMLARLASV